MKVLFCSLRLSIWGSYSVALNWCMKVLFCSLRLGIWGSYSIPCLPLCNQIKLKAAAGRQGGPRRVVLLWKMGPHHLNSILHLHLATTFPFTLQFWCTLQHSIELAESVILVLHTPSYAYCRKSCKLLKFDALSCTRLVVPKVYLKFNDTPYYYIFLFFFLVHFKGDPYRSTFYKYL